jgi:acyl CoA:acetate/3-ketoacid CoA transferase beta subunit
VVKKIVSELAVIEVTSEGLVLRERAPGVSVDEIKKSTEAALKISGDVPEMRF